MTDASTVTAHYGTADLVDRVAAALRAAGLGEVVLPWRALVPLDQFHVGGAAATAALAEKLGVQRGDRLLDVGCGLGGPARHLAAEHGCRVTGVDLNPPLVALARMLTARCGMAGQVSHEVADACALPFPDGSFDLAWSQHVAMNIADRAALYGGIFRVLRPGGRLGLFDVLAGAAGPLEYPVPWARDPAASHLLDMAQTRAVLEASGFRVLHWADMTTTAQTWLPVQQAATQSRPEALRPLALPLVMGPDFPALAANLGRNLREGRAALLQAVLERPA